MALKRSGKVVRRLLLDSVRIRVRQRAESIGAFLARHSTVLGAAAILFLTGVVVKMEWTEDLGLNLLAEGIGIGWTVFIIDQLLKRREERRWQPSKHLVYAELLEMVNELLRQILPFEMWKGPGMFYRYGERAVYLSRFPREVTLKRLMTLIVPEMSANGDWPQMHHLVRAKQVLYETMMRSSFLIEPELMHRLLGFGERLAALEHIKVAFDGDPHLCQEMAEGFGKVILQTLAIYEFLLQQADTRESREEYIQRVKAVLQDIHERYG